MQNRNYTKWTSTMLHYQTVCRPDAKPFYSKQQAHITDVWNTENWGTDFIICSITSSSRQTRASQQHSTTWHTQAFTFIYTYMDSHFKAPVRASQSRCRGRNDASFISCPVVVEGWLRPIDEVDAFCSLQCSVGDNSPWKTHITYPRWFFSRTTEWRKPPREKPSYPELPGNNNHFTVLCPGLPGWAGTRKKHSPTHHPDHHPIFISFFHLPRSIASSLFKWHAWQSFCTTSLHVRKMAIKTELDDPLKVWN